VTMFEPMRKLRTVGKCIMNRMIVSTLHLILEGEACSAYERYEKTIHNFGWNQKARD
jgi:hypothetical protein